MMRDSLRWTAVGLAVGLAGAAVLTRYIDTLIFGVAPTDPATFAFIAVGLMSTALV